MKRAVLVVSDEFLMHFISNVKDPDRYYKTWTIIKNPLPEDAFIIKAYVGAFGNIHMVIQSDSFRDIDPGEEYPILEKPCFHVEAKEA